MKINCNKKNLTDAPKKITRLIFKEKSKTRLKEYESGKIELNIELPAKKDMTLQRSIYTLRSALRTAKELGFSNLGISFGQIKDAATLSKIDEERAGFLFALNTLMADFSFDQRKSNKDSREIKIETMTVFGDVTNEFKEGLKRGMIVGEEVNNTRFLCNTPGTELLPSALAKAAKDAVKGVDIKVTVLNKKKIASMKMGGILGVGRGSDDGPFLVLMKYEGAGKEQKPVALIGKGITFDTGGINLKPSNASLGMHMDMSGGGAVIHTIVAAARLKLKVNIIAVVPAVENVVAGGSYKPGDFLTTMSGKTVEVTHTDAEGRLVLADALTYVKRFKPKTVIDVATLTGASVVSLGDKYSALFCENETLKDSLIEAGEKSGERVWRLPMGEEYGREMKGNFTDLVNAGKKAPHGGACTAAAFLKEFTDYTDSWAHIDIAPRMEAGEHDCLAKGSVGAPVALLIEYLTSIQNKK